MNEIKVAPDDVLGYMTMKKYKNNETIVVMCQGNAATVRFDGLDKFYVPVCLIDSSR